MAQQDREEEEIEVIGERMAGRIARLNKGYGFIEGSDGRDYFFHWSSLDKFSKHFRNLAEGDAVDFDPGRTDKGPRAINISTP